MVSACTNLQRLVCEYSGGPQSEMDIEDSSLSLLWQNRGLHALEFDAYESHVRRHVLPNLLHLTNLQRLKLTFNDALLVGPSLLLDILQCLPPSLLELIVQVSTTRGWGAFSDKTIAPSSGWEPSSIRRLFACPQLQCLELPAASTSHAKELMGTLATSCPQLSWLKLSSDRTPTAPSECLYLPQMPQKFTILSLSIYNDIDNLVVPTVLAHSAATLRELYLENAKWLTRQDVPKILCSCPELRILRVNASSDPAGFPMASTTLQHLVERPWVCTRLQELSLAITDEREPSVDLEDLEETDHERKMLARMVLRLHYQLQDLKEFSPFCSFRFFGLRFITMPLEIGLQHMNWQMTEDDLRRLGLWWHPTEMK
ncbi:hypothetical protein EC968_003714 [Mortierella alpina]|nr:hypothetical protein EC968_003714 [Mortierella alpina]